MNMRSFIQMSSMAACVVLATIIFMTQGQASKALAAESPAATPSHQVIACYFHRTVRCPTCKKISAYIEEAVQTSFDPQVKDGSVKMMMVDFQDPKNQNLTQAYKITGPTLIIMDVHGDNVTAWKPAPKVWSLVGRKTDFFKYVQGEVQSYLDGKKLTMQ